MNEEGIKVSARPILVLNGRTDGQTDIAQMSPRNLGYQINISGRYTRIDKTKIPSMRRI